MVVKSTFCSELTGNMSAFCQRPVSPLSLRFDWGHGVGNRVEAVGWVSDLSQLQALRKVKPLNQIRAGALKGRFVIEKLAAHPEFQNSPST